MLLGALAYLVRSNTDLLAIDRGVAKWGNRHSSPMTMHVLNDITQLGSIYTVIALCIVLAIAETIREESVWVIPFIAVVIGGEELVTNTVKQLDRPSAANIQPRSGDTRALVSEWPLRDGRRLLRHRSSPARQMARTSGAGRPRGSRSRNRRCGRREPCPTRRSLAERCDRRTRARLGVVRGVRESRSAGGSFVSGRPLKSPVGPWTKRWSNRAPRMNSVPVRPTRRGPRGVLR